MAVAAIYARYSTDGQKETSIADQVRRCKETAEKHGYGVKDELIFSDSAISGSAKEVEKREAYQRLKSAWDKSGFQCIILDEVSRISRDMVEIAKLSRKIDETGVRLLTVDGTDSSNPQWQLTFQILGVIAQNSLKETAFRVQRGMQGQLERGFMVATPPFGYQGKQVGADGITPVESELATGTVWEIDEEEAKVVRDIYSMRNAGKSFVQIAKELNTRGIVAPRPAKDTEKYKEIRYWRPGSIHRIVNNPIYRGIFVWHRSPSIKAKAKKLGITPDTKEYSRPELRLVDDATWILCNHGRVSRTKHGGGKHALAGLVTCGFCEATLTVSSRNARTGVTSLYCAECAQAKAVGAAKKTSPGYITTTGVQELIKYALRSVLTDPSVVEEFRKRLKNRLTGRNNNALVDLEGRLQKADQRYKRMVKLLAELDNSEPLEVQVKVAHSDYMVLKNQYDRMKADLDGFDVTDIERQLKIEPVEVLDRLFDSGVPIEQIRAVLQRIFKVFKAIGKTSRFESHFELTLVPGIAIAQACHGAVQDNENITRRFRVTGGAKRPTRWAIMEY